jgi:IS30 family transposase
MSRKPLNEEIINQIISLRRDENLSSKKIRERLNISPQSVTKYLKESGCEISRSIPLSISPVEIEKMRRLKRQGVTLREISEELGYAVSTVSFYTTEYQRGRIWNRDNVLALLVECDFDYAKVAKKINRKKSNVSFLTKKFGLKEIVELGRERIKKQKDVIDSEKIKELHKAGFNSNKIAVILHRSTLFVLDILNGERLKRKTKKTENKNKK